MKLGAERHPCGGWVPEDPLDFSDPDGLRCYLQGIYILTTSWEREEQPEKRCCSLRRSALSVAWGQA